MVEASQEVGEILTDEDLKNLKSTPEFIKYLTYLKGQLDTARLEVDGVKPDGLPVLQGRIAALKQTINLFEDVL